MFSWKLPLFFLGKSTGQPCQPFLSFDLPSCTSCSVFPFFLPTAFCLGDEEVRALSNHHSFFGVMSPNEFSLFCCGDAVGVHQSRRRHFSPICFLSRFEYYGAIAEVNGWGRPPLKWFSLASFSDPSPPVPGNGHLPFTATTPTVPFPGTEHRQRVFVLSFPFPPHFWREAEN